MYALVDPGRDMYTVCTPVRDEDDADFLELDLGVLRGGLYLRGRLTGEPPALYDVIPAAMAELEATRPRDHRRPLVEFYRRHDEIELWLPI